MKYVIGVDPGVFCGFANWCKTTRRLIDIKTLTFWGLIKELEQLKKLKDATGADLLVLIEDPNFNKSVFAKKSVANQSALNKIAQNIGENKRMAKLIIQWCEENELKHSAIAPRTEKWDKKYFFKLTGYKGTVSQHAIDAAKLCYGY